MNSRRGAKFGNKYGAYGRKFRQAIICALVEADDTGDMKKASNTLRRIALKLVEKALKGEDSAIHEIADRMDGKAQQSLEARITHSLAELRDADNLETRLTEKLARRTQPVEDIVH